MANQGILAQSKPAANTDTVLYSTSVTESASTVLSIANDGTGSTFDVGIKNFDQKLTLDASTYLLHPGDVISGYRFTVDVPIAGSNSNFAPGTRFVSADQESAFKFESFYVPPLTTIYVKDISIKALSLESATGTFAAGETITKGVSPNHTTAVIYSAPGGEGGTPTIYIGPETINGSGTALAAGDSVSSSGGAAGTIATGGIGTAEEEFVFSTTTAGGTYDMFLQSTGTLFTDRVYRFDLADATMSGRDFKLSTTANGEWGPDGTVGTEDDGTEYTTGKTTNGTAGSTGAYVQYDFTANTSLPETLYYYDGGTGTATNANYGGSDRGYSMSSATTFTEFYVYDIEGTWTNSSDGFATGGTTFTVTAQTAGPYGFVRSFSGTTLYVIKGEGSGDFAGSDTFRDVPKLSTANRSIATVSSVDVATAALEAENYIAINHANAANNDERITSLVVGPGERVVVNSTTQNNVFSLVGFEDLSTSFTTQAFAQSTSGGGE